MNTQSYETINQVCCCFNLRKATRAVTQLFDRQLEKAAGIRSTQFTLLVELFVSSGKTLTDMSQDLGMDRTTLTRNLKPLSKAGFIECVPLADKRSKGYLLTDTGKQILERGLPMWKASQAQIVGQYGEARYQNLLEELTVVGSLAQIAKDS